jgi:hypothetical protein
LRTTVNGAVAWARDEAGWRHARATLEQLRTLAKDGPIPRVEIEDWPDLDVRGIHLDLKYMMHRPGYLLSWLDDLAGYKINTLLLEYEDKFPYRRHPVLRHKTAFTEEQLREFLSRARTLGLRVVPLIQTLGHVEYILKHPEFAHLRKNDFVTELDTQHPDTWPFLRAMLDEVLEFHREDEWFHIGGDECWNLMQQKPAVRARLYGEHMNKVLRHVLARGKRPLIWDDMMRGIITAAPELKPTVFGYIPRETIVCWWGYAGVHHPKIPERGAGLRTEKATARGRFALFRNAGYDVLSIPCHDWGPVIPYYALHTVTNTLERIHDAVDNDCLGVMNSHWASFHCPLPLQDYGIALTADRSWRLQPGTMPVRDFDEAYCRLNLGVPNRAFVEALYQMGDAMLEMPTNLGRPIHLGYWYYMDAVLHYPHGHADRLKYGPAAPLEAVDFAGVARKKLRLLDASPDRVFWLRALERAGEQASAAGRLLKDVGHDVKRSRELYTLTLWLAEFRAHACRRYLVLAQGGGRSALLATSRRLRKQMRRIYGHFLLPSELALEETSLFDGEERLLAR